MIDRISIARPAAALAMYWHTANDAGFTAGRELLIEAPHRLASGKSLGVDEHCWRHPGRRSSYVAVVIDLFPVREGADLFRLLDMVPGQSAAVFKTWLNAQSDKFHDGIEMVAIDGVSGFRTATAEEFPEATATMDPSHVVALTGDAPG